MTDAYTWPGRDLLGSDGEVPIVDKQTVLEERVSLQKDTFTEERELSEQVRKERIETEGDHAA